MGGNVPEMGLQRFRGLGVCKESGNIVCRDKFLYSLP